METRWSLEFQRKRELAKTLEVPTISETVDVVGLPLALIIFEQSHQDLKQDYGLEPYLEGPQGELWVSPSDLLIGKVALTPPLTQKHIQALTHQGILELGSEIEQKFLNEMRIEREKAVQEREDYLKKIFEVQRNQLIANLSREHEERYASEMDEMRIAFENRISQLLWECYEQVRVLEEQMQIEIDSLNILWQAALEEEIKQTTERITEEFLEKMRLQEQVLVSIFTKQIRDLKMKKKCAIDFERVKCKEILIQMKHKLHCQNIANLMYLLCKERRRCKDERTAMDQDFTAELRKRKRIINAKSRTIKKLIQQKNKKIRQLDVRERCLIEILRQFQKFIYFALKAAPTQGEFLLNIDKLIKFELEDYCLPKETKALQTDKRVSAQVRELGQESIGGETEDYSKQIEEYIKHSKSGDQLEESDVLPAMYFNDKVYIREDFRDMLAAGIELDRKNSLWNADVEELIAVFKKQMDAKRPCQMKLSHHSSVRFDQFKEKLSSESVSDQIYAISPDSSPPETPNRSPLQSIEIQEHKMPNYSPRSPSMDDEEKEIRKVSLDYSNKKEKEDKDKKTRKPSIVIKESKDSASRKRESYGLIRPDNTRRNTMTQSRLTLARDSVILTMSTMERKSIQYMSSKIAKSSADKMEEEAEEEAAEEEEEALSYREIKPLDEESLDKSLESQESIEKTGSRPTSKLLLAQDSYEIIKSTIAIVGEKLKDQEEPPIERKSQLTFDPKVSVHGRTFENGAAKKVVKGKKIIKRGKSPQGRKAVVTPKSTPRSAAKVVGSRKTKEHLKTTDEFTEERIKDLVGIMKENPSLIRLFTPCLK